MSFIYLLIIKNDKVYNPYLHYRAALRILEQGADELARIVPGKYRDAGYIIIDYDKKTIISSQDAFTPKKKGFEVVEV
ncbi:MAG: hypothetical protein QXT19_03060 [Candidatus Woesearchaeota archaeon]